MKNKTIKKAVLLLLSLILWISCIQEIVNAEEEHIDETDQPMVNTPAESIYSDETTIWMKPEEKKTAFLSS